MDKKFYSQLESDEQNRGIGRGIKAKVEGTKTPGKYSLMRPRAFRDLQNVAGQRKTERKRPQRKGL